VPASEKQGGRASEFELSLLFLDVHGGAPQGVGLLRL
jgi:hypothetical protein